MSTGPATEATRSDAAGLAAEIRRRLGPPPDEPPWPRVSMVVPNRDGATLLRRLLRGLREHTDYPSFELIVVDNASADDSLGLLRDEEARLPISTIANDRNVSFSAACNQGASAASGELLLFLNNDTEPFERGWLRELVDCRRQSGAAATASTLICGDREHEREFGFGFGVQHRGLEFRPEGEARVTALRGWEDDPLDEHLGQDAEPPALAAACLLVDRRAFREVGEFTEGFDYGAEDADLCMKLRSAGHSLRLSGRSIVIHHPVSTRRRAPFEEARARKLANQRLLWERWGDRLR